MAAIPTKIEISHKTILFTVLVGISIWFLFEIRDIVLSLIVAFIIATALRPLVDAFSFTKFPRSVIALFVYIILFGLLGLSFGGVIPTMIRELFLLLQNLPTYINKLAPNYQFDTQSLFDQIAPIGQNVVQFTLNVFSNIFSVFTVLVFSFYTLVERDHILEAQAKILGDQRGEKVRTVFENIEAKIGSWVLGQITLMFLIAIVVYIGLMLLHVEYALPLAILAGLLEVVPIVGPIASSIPSIIVAASTSPLLALSVAALYFIVQQLENHLIVPLVMRQSVGLSPVVTIIALMIGSRFAGITGALLAVPLVLVFQVLLVTLLKFHDENQKKLSV